MVGGFSSTNVKWRIRCILYVLKTVDFTLGMIIVDVTVLHLIIFKISAAHYMHYRFYADEPQQQTVTKQLHCYARTVIVTIQNITYCYYISNL